MTVDLSVIIVSWNVADLLSACLDSLTQSSAELAGAGKTMEIIVVDSASSDHTVTMLNDRYPYVMVLTQSENVGFTRGNNIGLARATGHYLMLLNPDTEVLPGALATLMAYMDDNPTIGIAGPHTFNSDRISTQSTRRRFPTLAVGYFESTWFQPYAPKALLDRYTVRDVTDDATALVDWVQGSAMLVRRAVYKRIGGLDEGFVMYSEELDWCKRAVNAGWQVAYVGDAHIVHHGGKSSEQVAARTHIHFQQSKLRYFRKHHSAGAAHLLRLFLLMNYALQLLIEAAKSAVGHKRPLRQTRIQAYWQVLRSGLKVT